MVKITFLPEIRGYNTRTQLITIATSTSLLAVLSLVFLTPLTNVRPLSLLAQRPYVYTLVWRMWWSS